MKFRMGYCGHRNHNPRTTTHLIEFLSLQIWATTGNGFPRFKLYWV